MDREDLFIYIMIANAIGLSVVVTFITVLIVRRLAT